MGLITLTNIGTGAPIISADHRNNYNTIQTVINGNLDSANVKPAGLLPSNIQGGVVGIGIVIAMGG